MPIATNPQTGETVYLADDGSWQKAQTAVNPQTKELLAHDGKDWVKVPAQSKGVLGYIDDAVRSIASGVTFGYADELAAKANSMFGSGTYEENLAKEQARNAQIPLGIKVPGEIAGAVGATVASAPITGPAAAAAGLARLPGYVRAILGGGAAGALYGSGEADPGNRMAGAAQGGVIGAGAAGLSIPIAAGVQKLAQPIGDLIRGVRDPEAEAARRVVTGLQRDMRNGDAGLSPAEFVGAHQAGQPVTIMDIGGETTRAMARDAANKNPEARAILNRTIDDRFEGQGGRITGWLGQRFNYPDAFAQQQALDHVERVVNRAAYNNAYRAGDRPLWSPELERLAGSPAVQDALRSAVTTGKDRAITQGFGGFRSPFQVTQDGQLLFNRGPNGVPTYPNLQFWDATRRDLSTAAAVARRRGADDTASVLGNLARNLNAELDRLVPAYQRARQGASQFFGAENALEAGQRFVTQDFAIPQTRQALARMSPAERQLFQDGFVSRLIESIDRAPDRRNVVGMIGASPAARQKLEVALGPQRARELEAYLHVEAIMDRSRGAVQGNSTTTRQLIEGGLVGAGGYGVSTGDYDPRSLLTAAFVGGAIRGGGQRIAQRIDQNVARRVADLLTSNDIRQLNMGLQIVTSRPVFLQALRNANAGAVPISAGVSSQTSKLPVPQIPASRAEDQPGAPRPPGQ